MNMQTLNPKFITDAQGIKTEVILSIDIFNQLIEDIQDLAVVAERRNESTISHQQFMSELKNDALL